MRGCFVTGTDTGAGKTIVAAALCAAIAAAGERVAAHKPVMTGLGQTRDDDWPADHELLAAASGARPEEVCARTFEAPLSPHLAAELAGTELPLDGLVAAARERGAGADVLVMEGVGGLLVPLDREHLVRDFAVALGLPLVIAARPGLGTINHSLLTLEAARVAGLDVRAVVLTPWPSEPAVIHRSNQDTIARLGGVEVATLPFVGGVDELAAAGATLPWRSWLGHAA